MPVRKFKDLTKAFKNFREDLNPNGIRRVLFLKSEWEDFLKNKGVSKVYLAYRAVYMTYFLSAIAFNLSCSDLHVNYYSIYLTNWAMVTQTIYGTLAFVNLLYHFLVEKFQKEDVAILDALLPSELNIVEKIIWMLLSTVCVLPVIVTLVYWGLIYPRLAPKHMGYGTYHIPHCGFTANLLQHVGNCVFAVIDLMVNALPVHVTHFVYLGIYAMIYISFTIFYEIAHGKYPYDEDFIYPILNWKKRPGLAVFSCILILFMVGIVHMMLWAVYILRLIIVSAIFKYDVYSYHEYTYKTSPLNTPATNRSRINTATVDISIEVESGPIEIETVKAKTSRSRSL